MFVQRLQRRFTCRFLLLNFLKGHRAVIPLLFQSGDRISAAQKFPFQTFDLRFHLFDRRFVGRGCTVQCSQLRLLRPQGLAQFFRFAITFGNGLRCGF